MPWDHARTWWDRRSPWARAARAEVRSKEVLEALLDAEREFTAYITWATQRIDTMQESAWRTLTLTRAERSIASFQLALVRRWMVGQRDEADRQRDSARRVAVRLEQENAHLLDVVRSANRELCKAVMWAPAERMPELAAVLGDVDEALAGVHG